MEARKCLICGTRHWSTEPCPAAKESTAARKDVLPISRTEPAASRLCPDAQLSHTEVESGGAKNRVGDEAASRELKVSTQAGTQALPVDTPPKPGKGRPASIDDMKTYKALKAKEYRQRDKAKKGQP